MGRFTFLSQGVPHAFREKKRLTAWLERVAREHGTRIESICFVLMSDEALRGYNQRFLGRGYFTDVIAFDGQAGAGISGDVLISYDRTKENAARFGSSHQHELRRVMVHALLHLLGHTDGSAQEKAAMRLLEDAALKRY